ncbi:MULTISPECIES: hypothetical protein [Sphingomonadaceae]|uniref:hypothetical protein n=1 Tax=Sphingomonadales TaxID=204457 RepID=UPI0007706C67|nr:hypothetical protein [Sphingobium sp. TKS]AMK23212.1 hypothetical protein K426_11370 [Sphingobium sp. TKS]MCF8709109.1 hypothetical protein [Rhizorhapis sp. SPR117]
MKEWASQFARTNCFSRETNMADRASASMQIGGTLSRIQLPAFIEAIATDHGRLDWEGEPVEEDTITTGNVLEICAYDLPGGMFETVESFCRQHKLPFRRTSGGCSGVFGPELVVYDLQGQPRHYEMNESEQVVLTRNEIHDLGSIEKIEDWFRSAEFTPPPIVLLEAGDPGSLAADFHHD